MANKVSFGLFSDVGIGDDTLWGGSGNDKMIGCQGADTFLWAFDDVLDALGVNSVDRIGDFSSEDTLDLSSFGLDADLSLDQLMSFEEIDRGTMVSVNLGGKGNSFTDLALLQDVFSASAESFLDDDVLII